MEQKLWSVPTISVVTGLILSVVSYVLNLGVRHGTFGLEMLNLIAKINALLALILFVVTGIFCLKDMSRKDIIKSAAIVSIYYICVFAIEQISQAAGFYSYYVVSFLYVPLKLFTSVLLITVQLTHWNAYILSIPTFFLPFLYILFGKKAS